jgi:hypothetical protein
VRAHLEVRPGLALAKCGRLWPAAAGSGLAAAGSGQLRPAMVRPSLAMLRSDLVVVRLDQARCGLTYPGAAGPAPLLRRHEAHQAKKLDFVDWKSEDKGSKESLKNSPPQSPRENRLPPMAE